VKQQHATGTTVLIDECQAITARRIRRALGKKKYAAANSCVVRLAPTTLVEVRLAPRPTNLGFVMKLPVCGVCQRAVRVLRVTPVVEGSPLCCQRCMREHLAARYSSQAKIVRGRKTGRDSGFGELERLRTE
jgi:hypothetical protein